jgi:hypothetical protein
VTSAQRRKPSDVDSASRDGIADAKHVVSAQPNPAQRLRQPGEDASEFRRTVLVTSTEARRDGHHAGISCFGAS